MDKMQLGPWVFTPSEYSISDGATHKELEPLLSKLLHYFAVNPGKILSRQQLVDTIWQQSYVDDNAINRAISELRKALLHPALTQAPIKTHHRKGYSLQLQPLGHSALNSVIPAIKEANPRPLQPSHKRRSALWLGALGLLLLGVVGTGLYFAGAEPEQPALSQQTDGKPQLIELDVVSQQKVTWFKGIESRPLLSPDKQLLAYSHSQPDGQIRVIVRQLGVSSGKLLQEVSLEDDKHLYSVQSWQPLSRNLLVQVVSKDGKSCEYQNYDFSQYPQYQVKPLTHCDGLVFGNAQLSADGQTLYYSKGSGGMYTSNALLAENLTSGAVQTLQAAPSAGLGTTVLTMSADGSQLAYILMPESNKSDIYIYQPASREHRRIASLPIPVLLIGLEWSQDQQSLLLPGADAIIQVDIVDKSLRVLKLPQGVIVGELSLLSDNQAYISNLTAGSATQGAMQLVKITQPFDDDTRQISFLHNAAGSALALAVSPLSPDNYAFSANWTGGWQLWLSRNGANVQLTELPNDEQPINSISWSGDGRYIAFIKQGNLYLYDIQRQQLINKLELNDVGQPLWLPDNSGLILTRVQANNQNLWQFDLVSNQLTQLTFSAGNFAQYDTNGQLLFHKEGKLYQYVDGARQDILLQENDDANFMAVWLHQGNQQYRYSMLGHIELRDQTSGETQHSQLPYQLMAVHPDPHSPDTLYATVFVTPELALEFIQWQVKK
ncbi:DNA-binding protein [Arsukibacterium ikkense]|uniref:DNA-binding protein n=1 Tax=Arsukibacterium ikkense TaxID=336831 RepID=A0A0M2V8E1_9GAMM|nr:winged helix-turn-helix domain-containing protein [Arsukibacterium ikkense]KKO45930.1 DNA-binding protein [Arsukibacterium ikkense]